MKSFLSLGLLFLFFASANSQPPADWYSESSTNGITIQNSYPKGGPYPGPTQQHFRYSYLVFFSRVVNESGHPLDLSVHFQSDSIGIPNSPDTYMKLFLPSETMTLDKRSLFSYGITELESLDQATHFQGTLQPGEDVLFYVVALFYQTRDDIWEQERGGNRGELVLQGEELSYRMLPQVEALPCGRAVFQK